MAGSSSNLTGESLSSRFTDCLGLYKSLVYAINAEDCAVAQQQQIDITRILDEYGRAKTWGDQTLVTLPPRTRGSLDHTLRHDPELQVTIQDILSRLKWCLDQGRYLRTCDVSLADCLAAISIAKEKHDTSKGSDQGLNSDELSGDSDSTTDGDEGSGRPKKSKFAWLVEQAFEQIQSLFYSSSLLRGLKFSGKHVLPVDGKARAELLEEEISFASAFRTLDREHVLEKVRQWHGLTRNADVSFDDEEGASADHLHARPDDNTQFQQDTTVLCQRLANANTQRREQLKYWAENPDTSIEEASVPGSGRISNLQCHASAARPSGQELPIENNQLRSSSSQHGFSILPKTILCESQRESENSSTAYAKSNASGDLPNRVPDAPTLSTGDMSFPCPCCGIKLTVRETESRKIWK